MRSFLNKNGEVIKLHSISYPALWAEMSTARDDYCSKKTADLLKKYGLEFTIFNVTNIQRWGLVHLPEHFVGVVLEHGAKDRREDHVILVKCEVCNKKTFELEAEGMGWREINGEQVEVHYPVGSCWMCD